MTPYLLNPHYNSIISAPLRTSSASWRPRQCALSTHWLLSEFDRNSADLLSLYNIYNTHTFPSGTQITWFISTLSLFNLIHRCNILFRNPQLTFCQRSIINNLSFFNALSFWQSKEYVDCIPCKGTISPPPPKKNGVLDMTLNWLWEWKVFLYYYCSYYINEHNSLTSSHKITLDGLIC